ncbi:MAG: hypothetical protein ACFBSE_02200 [Prochloraceae cyanobacterium]
MNSEPVSSHNFNSAPNHDDDTNHSISNGSSFQKNLSKIEEEDLQLLAKEIYERLLDRFSIELERKYGSTPLILPWSSTIQNPDLRSNLTGNKKHNLNFDVDLSNDDSFNFKNNKIEELTEIITRQIYILLLDKIRSDRERSRIYYDFFD